VSPKFEITLQRRQANKYIHECGSMSAESTDSVLVGNRPMLTRMQIVDALKQSPLFCGLDRKALHEMSNALVLTAHPGKCDILPPAQTAQRFHVIVRGRVKITRSNGHDGRELTLWLLGPGDGFDVVSLLDGEPHAVSAWTLEEVQTLCAPVSVFREWMERYPAFRLALYRYVAKRLREVTELAGGLALHDTMTRLVHLLLRHFDVATSASHRRGELIRDLSHDELASMIGTVRVVVNRLLARLKKESIIELHNGRLGVVNLRRLLRHADTHLVVARKDQRDKSIKA
jgi:CRP/FNR family transcriptional regulator, cyclic AMP receptor protein